MAASRPKVVEIVKTDQSGLLQDWVREQLAATTLRADLLSEQDLREQSREFLGLLRQALESGDPIDVTAAPWADARAFLETLSRSWAEKGFTPAETAMFVFSLKQPLFSRLRRELAQDVEALVDEIWAVTVLLDKLGLYTAEVFIRSRQEAIARQQQELLELSTPVVKVWDGVLALPLIGTLDSARTQVVMESLLQQIVSAGSQVAIIDITGVPMVDTLVAQHLLKTVAAARLMGAECIISGIRPQIAQTMVHLGVAFGDVVTKATLAEAIQYAFKLQGLAVGKSLSRT
jgi:rsbT co-antagonist protein RsbR